MSKFMQGISLPMSFSIRTNLPIDTRFLFDSFPTEEQLPMYARYEGLFAYIKDQKQIMVLQANDVDGALDKWVAPAADLVNKLDIAVFEEFLGKPAVEAVVENFVRCDAAAEGALEVVADGTAVDGQVNESVVKAFIADIIIGEFVQHIAPADRIEATGHFKTVDDLNARIDELDQEHIDLLTEQVKEIKALLEDLDYDHLQIKLDKVEFKEFVGLEAGDVIPEHHAISEDVNALEVVANDVETFDPVTQIKLENVITLDGVLIEVGDKVALVAEETVAEATGYKKHIAEFEAQVEKFEEHVAEFEAFVGKEAVEGVPAHYEKVADSSVDGALLVVDNAGVVNTGEIDIADVVGIAVAGEYVVLVPEVEAAEATGHVKVVEDIYKAIAESKAEASGFVPKANFLPEAHGGLGVNVDLSKLTLNEILNAILFPKQVAKVNMTSAAFGVKELGTSVADVINIAITKGDAELKDLKVVDELGVELALNPEFDKDTLNYTVDINTDTNKKIKVILNDEEQQIVQEKEILFVEPMFVGVLASKDEAGIKAMDKVVAAKGNVKKEVALADQVVGFAFPKEYGDLAGILDLNINMNSMGGFEMTEVAIVNAKGDMVDYVLYSLINQATLTVKY